MFITFAEEHPKRKVKKFARENPGQTKVFPNGIIEIGDTVDKPSDKEILENIQNQNLNHLQHENLKYC